MLNNFTVRTRLLAGFLTIAILGAIVAAIGIINMSRMNDQAERAYASDLLGISSSKEANINLIYIGRAMRNVMLATTPEEKAKFTAVAETARKTMAERIAVARPLFRSEEAMRLFAEFDKGLADYDSGRATLMKMIEDTSPEGHTAAVEYMFGPLGKQANYLDDKLSAIGNNKEKAAAASAAEAAALYSNSRTLMMVLVLCSLGVGVGLGLWITRSLTKQLVGSSRVDLQACKLEYSIVSPK